MPALCSFIPHRLGGVGTAIAPRPRPRPALSTPCPFSLKMFPESELSSPLVLWASPRTPNSPKRLKPSGSPRYPAGSPPSCREPRPGGRNLRLLRGGDSVWGPQRHALPMQRGVTGTSAHRAPPADRRPAPALRARRTDGKHGELQSRRGLRGKGRPRRGKQGEGVGDRCGRQLCRGPESGGGFWLQLGLGWGAVLGGNPVIREKGNTWGQLGSPPPHPARLSVTCSARRISRRGRAGLQRHRGPSSAPRPPRRPQAPGDSERPGVGAAVTKHPRRGGLQEGKFILSQFWGPEVQD